MLSSFLTYIKEMNMQIRLENGELRADILGSSPVLDSPIMHLETSRRHYVVLRMMYSGAATQAQVTSTYLYLPTLIASYIDR